MNMRLNSQENVLQFGSVDLKKLKWEGIFHGCYKNALHEISYGKGRHYVGIGDTILFN